MRRRRNQDIDQPGKSAADLRSIIFGQNVRAARIKAGLTQAQLAERTGLTQQYVSLVEAGHQNITLDTMAALRESCRARRECPAPEGTRPYQAEIIHALPGSANEVRVGV